jgi:hypothetical protein
MEMLTHCRAMAAFCRQRAKIEDENEAFWLEEAELWATLISDYAIVAAPNPGKTESVKRPIARGRSAIF